MNKELQAIIDENIVSRSAEILKAETEMPKFPDPWYGLVEWTPEPILLRKHNWLVELRQKDQFVDIWKKH